MRRGYFLLTTSTDCGISLNGLKRYAESNEALQLAKKAGSKDKTIDIWISKNTAAIAKGIRIHYWN
jgi:hypothetical protein